MFQWKTTLDPIRVTQSVFILLLLNQVLDCIAAVEDTILVTELVFILVFRPLLLTQVVNQTCSCTLQVTLSPTSNLNQLALKTIENCSRQNPWHSVHSEQILHLQQSAGTTAVFSSKLGSTKVQNYALDTEIMAQNKALEEEKVIFKMFLLNSQMSR